MERGIKVKKRILFDDGDIRDEVYIIREDDKDKEVAFIHRTDYYSVIDIGIEKGYERILHYIPLNGDIRSIEVVEGLQSFNENGVIGYRWNKMIEKIIEPEEIEAFWKELVENIEE